MIDADGGYVAGLELVRVEVQKSQAMVGVRRVWGQAQQKGRGPDKSGIAEARGLVRGSAAGKVVREQRCRQHPGANWSNGLLAATRE